MSILDKHNSEKFVTCPMCNKTLKKITNSHLQIHNMDFNRFKFEYPDVEYIANRQDPQYHNLDKVNMIFEIPNAIHNKYYYWYMSIVTSRPNNRPGYVERHHIIPRSLGGLDNKDNIVVLTAREHFICHALLCKMFKSNTHEWYKMIHALMNMSANPMGQKRYMNSKIYESFRKDFSKVMSFNQSGKKNSNYQKVWIMNLELRINKKVPKSEIEVYLNKGYILGGCRNFDLYKKKLKNEPKTKEEILNERIRIFNNRKIQIDQNYQYSERNRCPVTGLLKIDPSRPNSFWCNLKCIRTTKTLASLFNIELGNIECLVKLDEAKQKMQELYNENSSAEIHQILNMTCTVGQVSNFIKALGIKRRSLSESGKLRIMKKNLKNQKFGGPEENRTLQ